MFVRYCDVHDGRCGHGMFVQFSLTGCDWRLAVFAGTTSLSLALSTKRVEWRRRLGRHVVRTGTARRQACVYTAWWEAQRTKRVSS